MLDEVTVPRVMVAGIRSGTGKTTVALGLAAALRRRGRVVQTFKVGPDLLDSAHLAHVSGRPCRNLDAWMLGDTGLRHALARGVMGADCAVVEGVAGLYDSHGVRGAESAGVPYAFPGSSAEVARVARCPVILVLDVGGMGETAAALALGVRQLDPRLRVIGVVLNNIAGEVHRRTIEDSVWELATLPVLGALPHLDQGAMPEWAMGLAPVAEGYIDRAASHLATAMERHCDLDLVERLMAAAEPVPPLPSTGALAGIRAERPAGDPVRVAVAYDEAFCSYYPENLELLEEAGAEIVPFSPLEERSLPRDIQGIYLGGGFPEAFADRLATNRSLAESLQRARAAGTPIYAESGGIMLLARSLRTASGEVHAMAGILPIDIGLADGRPRAGYRELRLMSDSMLGAAGTRLRGHEFHAAAVVGGGDRLAPAFSAHGCDGEPLGCEGWADGDVVASFVQLHFGQDPMIARRLVARMRESRRARRGEAVVV